MTVFFIFLVHVDTVVGLLIIPVIIIYGWFYFRFKKHLFVCFVNMKESMSFLNGFITKRLTFRRFIKMHGIIDAVRQEQIQNEQIYLYATKQNVSCSTKLEVLNMGVAQGAVLIVTLWCGYKVIYENMTIGTLQIVLAYVGSVISSVSFFAGLA